MPYGYPTGALSRSNPPTPVPGTINPMALQVGGSARNGGYRSEMDIDTPNGESDDSHEKRVRPNPLPTSSKKTGLCYDVRMRYHATVDTTDMHPEDPRRIFEIYKALCVEGLVDDKEFSGVKKKDDLMHRIDAREVTREEATLVHSEKHWEFLQDTEGSTTERLHELTRDGDSIYYNNESFFCSKLSCGGAIETCDAVAKGLVKNAIAVVRPPGHHAEPHKAMGFCLFNNVCVAAKVVMKNNPSIKKILILDWDVHHGNGTQKAFYDNPNILYMSIHRFQGGLFYPEGPEGGLEYCGEGKGAGMNVNVPWEYGGMGDGDYVYAFQKVIMPIAMEYNPDLVIVSAGFDAASGDTLGGCYVTPPGYAHMTHMLMSLANGKLVICLEGGYNLNSISHSAVAVTKVLMGEPPGRLHEGYIASDSAIKVIAECIAEQSKYWRCMKPQKSLAAETYESTGLKAERLNDLVRKFQATKLYELYGMTPLEIYRDQISTSFTNQVMATEDYIKKETIVFFVHDPPPVIAVPDPRTNRIALHKAFMVDQVPLYAQWAIDNDYAMIDANIPEALSGIDTGYTAAKHTEEVCTYIWDNYLEISDAQNIILVGAGQAVVGLIHLLVHRDCRERVKATISLIGENDPLRAVSSNIADEFLPEWYFNNSQIFISANHDAWERPRIRKKFGKLEKIAASEVHEILRQSFPRATEWLADIIPPSTTTNKMTG
ncbi:histone deacetylase Clr3 [Geopyxis carbonaria]|nr:histone deacetylase Clr3 [Geopyxis carbonaria]